MTAALSAALNDQEIDELADFLYDKAPADALNISELHGFLSAIVVGPELVQPSEWLPQIWGLQTDEEEATDLSQAPHILSLIMRLYNSINDQVRDQPQEYSPILMCNDDDSQPVIDDWCYGFMIGVSLRHEEWQPMLDDAEIGSLLLPIIACGMEYSGELVADAAPSPELRAELAHAIGELVPALYTLWHHAESSSPGLQ